MTFLEKVAADIIAKHGTNLARVAIVFPNKRASLFLNEHLANIVQKPLWSPVYISISELIHRHSELIAADPVKLVCDLHKVYCQCTGAQEPLDSFYGWGELLVADFDDIDKHMADAHKVFSTVTNLHELDSADYLNEEQRHILKRFFNSFTDGHDSVLKHRFLTFWNHLADIYDAFNKHLANQGLAYEGALYRRVAEDTNTVFEYDKYIFVGFNMLHESEQCLFRRLKEQGKAYFYWDYDHYYMTKGHEAGTFIREHLHTFPNELTADDATYGQFAKPKAVSIISSQSEDAQARYVTQWLQENNRIADSNRTAIVMCNEGLLPNVIHCLPDDTEVNITTGYPLQKSPVFTLVTQLIALQTGNKPGRKLRQLHVRRLLSHPYAQYVSPLQEELLRKVASHELGYSIPIENLALDEGLTMLFTLLPRDISFQQNLLRRMGTLLQLIGRNLATQQEAEPDAGQPLTQESIFRMYTLLQRIATLIENGDLVIDTTLLTRLLRQMVSNITIPFHGEPAVGVQVMGVLETRNLDFDHLLILSCNEGQMPKGNSDASFIPYSVRKAYGLTTSDQKSAIYAYYFYRLIQRAADVTLLYNNATEDGQRGEMSRFMLQLLVESGIDIRRGRLQAGQLPARQATDSAPVINAVAKDSHIMSIIRSIEKLSPTAINRYLRCPLQFYYYSIVGIREPDDMEEQIDHRHFGNIFHRAAELAYIQLASPEQVGKDKDGRVKLIKAITISKSQIEQLMKQKETITRIVNQAFNEEFPIGAITGTLIINLEVISRYLTQLLQTDRQLAESSPITILGLEKRVSIKPQTTNATFPEISGIIDRLDLIGQGPEAYVRVVDYKTGHQPQSFPANLDEVFSDETSVGKHGDYYLQTMLYATIIARNEDRYPVAPALFFTHRSADNSYNPVLTFKKESISDIRVYEEDFVSHLHRLLDEIYDEATPFNPTPYTDRCNLCPYMKICKP